MAIESVASLLRALSDPCRLRLLALCAERPASVSMLAAAVSETEPTVSRHLKALAAVGVLRRTRRGQRVEYSRAVAAPFADVVAAALRAAAADPSLHGARARLLESMESGEGGLAPHVPQHAAEGERRLGEALALILGAEAAAASSPGVGLLLSAGDIPIECLRLLTDQRSVQLLVAAATVAERTAQRRRLADAGLRGEVVLRGDLPERLAARRTAGPALISCLDLRMARSWSDIESWLRWLQRLPTLRSADWLLFDYDALDPLLGLAERGLLAGLRARLRDLGLDARRIQPLEADGQHRLLVHCAPRSIDAARAA